MDLRVAHVFLVGPIEEMPTALELNGIGPSRDSLTELLATVIERALCDKAPYTGVSPRR